MWFWNVLYWGSDDCEKYGTWFTSDLFLWRMELMDDRLIHEVRQEASRKINPARSNWYYGNWYRCTDGWDCQRKMPESGRSSDITFKQMRVQDLHSDKTTVGDYHSNPPYGERLSVMKVWRIVYRNGARICTSSKPGVNFILNQWLRFESKFGGKKQIKTKTL